MRAAAGAGIEGGVGAPAIHEETRKCDNADVTGQGKPEHTCLRHMARGHVLDTEGGLETQPLDRKISQPLCWRCQPLTWECISFFVIPLIERVWLFIDSVDTEESFGMMEIRFEWRSPPSVRDGSKRVRHPGGAD